MTEWDSWKQAERHGWRVVAFAADCDDDGNCPLCLIDYAECNCPGPTQDDLFDYAEIDGVLMARAKEPAR